MTNKLKYWRIIFLFILSACSGEPEIPMDPCGGMVPEKSPNVLTFESLDGLPMKLEVYRGSDDFQRAILFLHQAGMNKKEYCSIAQRLSKLGYNCVAIDLRSGGNLNGYENETYNSALSFETGTEFLDAYQDIKAAIIQTQAKSRQKIIVWGSSYSAGLAMAAAQEHPDKVQAVMAFSPGEYYGEDYILKEHINNLTIPTFITSSKEEANDDLTAIIDALPSDKMPKGAYVQYVPKSKGAHGSKVLWEGSPYKDEYWPVVMQFIEAYD